MRIITILKEICYRLNLIADYVVERGTSGIWTYRKWNSGIAECWGNSEYYTTQVTSAWGSVYSSASNSKGNTLYPFEFIEIPVLTVGIYKSSHSCWLFEAETSITHYPSTKQTGDIGILRATSSTMNVGFSFSAKGRWK